VTFGAIATELKVIGSNRLLYELQNRASKTRSTQRRYRHMCMLRAWTVHWAVPGDCLYSSLHAAQGHGVPRASRQSRAGARPMDRAA